MSSSTIIVDHFKNSFWHAWCKCFQKVSANVAPSGEDGFTKGIHCLELKSIFVNYPCHPSPNVLNWIKIRGTRRMVQKSDVILLEKSLGQTGILNWSVVLLKNPVVTTQTRALSHEGCPAATSPHSQLLFDAPAQPGAPLFHWRKKHPQIMMAPPPLCRVENISGGISLSCQ